MLEIRTPLEVVEPAKTTAKKNEKDFDAVKMMREIRDQLSREIMNMTHAEQKAYLKRLAKKAEALTKQ